jgi:hypothetical protein
MPTNVVAAEKARVHICNCRPILPAIRTREHLPLLAVVMFALLPKCPLCFAAWFGLFGLLGSASWLGITDWMTLLATGLLTIVVGSLTLRALTIRDPRPLLLCWLGVAALLAGKGLAGRVPIPTLFLFAGVTLLTGASLWSSVLKLSRTKPLPIST